MVKLTLRPAAASDRDFVRQVTDLCMRAYAEQTWGSWNGEADFDLAFDEIIQLDGQDIGIFGVEKHATHWQIDNFYILPSFQNQRHGSILMEQLKIEAAARNMPIRLSVLQVNPAQHFYARHGFGVVETVPPRIHMEFSPPKQ